MWEEIVVLFTDMGAISLVLVLLGVIFVAIEVCLPGFGVCGTLGIVCLTGGVVARALEGASITQICVMILICLIVLILAFLVVARSLRKGLLSKTGLVETGQVLETDFVSPKLKLVGKEGETIGVCRPSGKVIIDDEIYDCISEIEYIKSKTKVVVSSVKDDKLYVRILEEEKK